jgi:ParB/RepB/Spo0J family partition protein
MASSSGVIDRDRDVQIEQEQLRERQRNQHTGRCSITKRPAEGGGQLTIAAVSDIKAALEVQNIPLEQLEASHNNPRRTMNDLDLQELAASIRQHGIQAPLLVRPDQAYVDNDNESRYKIVCGHRRIEAATLAGLDSVPCIVRAMDDATAAEIALVDNLQRVDVPPLEEAEAFGELLVRLLSIAAVAARVGKEQSYIARRLKLRDLTVWSQDALRKKLITIDHALLLARLAAAEQDEALKWCLDTTAGEKKTVDVVIAERLAALERRKEDAYYAPWEPESVAALKWHIERETGETLNRAPWPLDSFLVSDEGPCSDCPKSTTANAPLFGDLAIGEPTCTDGRCFQTKASAWVQIKLREAGQDAGKNKHVPRLSWKFSSVKPATSFNDITAAGAMSTTADPSKVLKAGQWIEVKKGSCPNVRPGVTVDWNEAENGGYGPGVKKLRKPGETLQVCIASGCKVHRKEYEKAAQSNGASPRNDSKAYEEQQRKRKEALLIENQLRMGWAITAVGKVKKLPEMVLREALLDAIEDCDCELAVIEKHLFPKVHQTLNTADLASVAFAQAVAVLHIARNSLNLNYGDPSDGREAYIKALKQLGTDPSPAWAPKKPEAEKKAAPAKKSTDVKKSTPAKKSILNVEARKRIAAAQRKRWAAQR